MFSSRREFEMTDLSSKSKIEATRWSGSRRVMLGLAAALATMALVTPAAFARPAGAGSAEGLASLSTGELTLHRDGSKADPFVANVAATGAPAAADGFDWGDGAVGLGAGLLVGVLGFAAIGAYGGRRAQTA